MLQQFDHEAIKTMLNDGLSHMDISRRVGCSRERIRQLDLKYFFKTGNQRRAERTLNEPVQIVMSNHQFIEAAQKAGYRVCPCSQRMIYINGKSCYLRRASSHDCGNRNGKRYFILHHCAAMADFYIYACDKDFLIIPSYAAPIAETSISLSPMPNRGAHSKRHDFLQYLNAWNLLGRIHEDSKAS